MPELHPSTPHPQGIPACVGEAREVRRERERSLVQVGDLSLFCLRVPREGDWLKYLIVLWPV